MVGARSRGSEIEGAGEDAPPVTDGGPCTELMDY